MVMQTVTLPAIQDCFVALSTKEHIMTFCGVSNRVVGLNVSRYATRADKADSRALMKVRMPEQEIELDSLWKRSSSQLESFP